MIAQGYYRIPDELCDWITFLVKSLPARSIGTFIELLFGAMLTPTGFVTDAYLILNMQNHWTSYYKWLQEGRWSWVALSKQFIRLSLSIVPGTVIHLAIDDTLTLRASNKAPGSQIHHQHGNKPNLAPYVRGQCWVSLAIVFKRSEYQSMAIPALSRLIPSASNTGKLIAANTLMRSVRSLLKGKKVRVLVDSWFMRKVFITEMTGNGFDVVGQVRRDTRLYDRPILNTQKKSRGRPRKYGEKYTPKRVAHLKRTTVDLDLYGKKQTVRYRSRIVQVRFLDGKLVRAVWSEFKHSDGSWKKASLILSTDISMTPEEVIESYGLRWSIESMFHQLKQAWGLKEAWQQSRQTLHRWVHITMIGYGLLQLLSLTESEEVDALCCHSPWRKGNPRTAGQIRKGLVKELKHVAIRRWWNKTCKKFQPPSGYNIEQHEQKLKKAA